MELTDTDRDTICRALIDAVAYVHECKQEHLDDPDPELDVEMQAYQELFDRIDSRKA